MEWRSGSTTQVVRLQQVDSGLFLSNFNTGSTTRFVVEGGNVGIGTTSPSKKLDVYGDINFSDAIYYNGEKYIHSTGATTNLFVGYRSGNFTTTGIENTAIGYYAGNSLSTYASNYASWNTFVGMSAGANVTSGYMNTLIGRKAGLGITTGFANTLVGVGAGEALSGSASHAVMLGYYAGRWGSTGNGNVNIGTSAGYWSQNNSYNVAVGLNSLFYNSRGDYNVALGYYADYYTPTPPASATPSAGSGMGIGTYYWRVTYILDGSETSASHIVTTTTTTGNQRVTVDLPIYSGPMTCSARKLYRNTVDGLGNSGFFLVTQVNDNSTTSFLDTVDDGSLGAQLYDNFSSIMLGSSAQAFKSYQAIIGSAVSEIYLGKGVYSASPGSISLGVTSGQGSNNAGANFIINAGRGTGSAYGGYIAFQTTAADASSTSWNSYSERMRITANGYIGMGTSTPSYPLEIVSTGTSSGLSVKGDVSGPLLRLVASGTTGSNNRIGFDLISGYNGGSYGFTQGARYRFLFRPDQGDITQQYTMDSGTTYIPFLRCYIGTYISVGNNMFNVNTNSGHTFTTGRHVIGGVLDSGGSFVRSPSTYSPLATLEINSTGTTDALLVSQNDIVNTKITKNGNLIVGNSTIDTTGSTTIANFNLQVSGSTYVRSYLVVGDDGTYFQGSKGPSASSTSAPLQIFKDSDEYGTSGTIPIFVTQWGFGSTFLQRTYGGSRTNPTGLLSSNVMGGITTRAAVSGGTTTTGNICAISFSAQEDFVTTGNTPTQIAFKTTTGSTLSTRMTISGNGNICIGSSNPTTSALLDISGTTGALLLPRMSTTQRNALTASNGMEIYNNTTNKFQSYENGSWVDSIGGGSGTSGTSGTSGGAGATGTSGTSGLSERSFTWVIARPSAGDILGPRLNTSWSPSRVDAFCMSSTSVTFNIYYGTSPPSITTQLMASDLTAPTNGTSFSSFTTGLVAGNWLVLHISSVSGTPGQLTVTIVE
jgi:hypothetical protein